MMCQWTGETGVGGDMGFVCQWVFMMCVVWGWAQKQEQGSITNVTQHSWWRQWCAGDVNYQLLVKGVRCQGRAWFVAFASFCGVHTPAVTDFKLLVWCYAQSWKTQRFYRTDKINNFKNKDKQWDVVKSLARNALWVFIIFVFKCNLFNCKFISLCLTTGLQNPWTCNNCSLVGAGTSMPLQKINQYVFMTSQTRICLELLTGCACRGGKP